MKNLFLKILSIGFISVLLAGCICYPKQPTVLPKPLPKSTSVGVVSLMANEMCVFNAGFIFQEHYCKAYPKLLSSLNSNISNKIAKTLQVAGYKNVFVIAPKNYEAKDSIYAHLNPKVDFAKPFESYYLKTLLQKVKAKYTTNHLLVVYSGFLPWEVTDYGASGIPHGFGVYNDEKLGFDHISYQDLYAGYIIYYVQLKPFQILAYRLGTYMKVHKNLPKYSKFDKYKFKTIQSISDQFLKVLPEHIANDVLTLFKLRKSKGSGSWYGLSGVNEDYVIPILLVN